MLFGNHPRRERFRSIPLQYRHLGLSDEGTGIDTSIYKVDGTSMFAVVRLYRSCVGIESGEVRKERWMNIDQPSMESGDKFGMNNNHKTGESDEGRFGFLYRGEDGGLERGE